MRALILPAVFLCLAACSDGKPAFVRLVTEADLKEGVDTTARVGDILVDNGKVRFVFQAPGSSDTFNLWGGSLVDMHYGEGDDRLEEAFVQCDLRAFAPETFEIVQEGDSKTPAILRFVGKDGGVPHLDSLLPRPPLDAEITVDWTLEPDATTIQIDIRVKDLRKTAPRDIACGLLLFEGDRYDTYAPEGGFEPRGGEVSYLAAFAGDAETSWVLRRDGGELSMFGFPPIKIAGNESEVFLANSTHEERYFLGLGDGDLAGLQRQEGLQPEGAVAVSLSLSAALPADVPVWFTVFDPAAPASRAAKTLARTRDGVATIDVPVGDYEAEIFIDGLSFGRRPFTVSGAGDSVVLNADVGQLNLTIRELGFDGAPRDRPGRLVLRNTAGEVVVDNYFEAASVHRVPAGGYQVMVSGGPEHELYTTSASITVGGASIAATIPHVVRTDGWVSADLHVHGTRSADSNVSRRQRILGAAAEGVDVLIGTDHDVVTDYSTTLAELGLATEVAVFPGCEVSPLWGHTNGFPLYGRTGYWRAPWFSYDSSGMFEGVFEPWQVVETLRAEGAEVVQHNHPRSSQGVFNHIELDPMTGESVGRWPGADSVEVLNGKREAEYGEVLADIFGLYKAGRRITATGTSDVHGDTGVGYARTYVKGAGDGASNLQEELLFSGLRDGAAVASLGIFLDVTAVRGPETAGLSETMAAGPVQIRVRAQAPSWVDIDQLRIYQSGEVILERAVTAADTPSENGFPALRLDFTATATPTAGDFIMVEVRGGRSDPFIDNALALSNPIWFGN